MTGTVASGIYIGDRVVRFLRFPLNLVYILVASPPSSSPSHIDYLEKIGQTSDTCCLSEIACCDSGMSQLYGANGEGHPALATER